MGVGGGTRSIGLTSNRRGSGRGVCPNNSLLGGLKEHRLVPVIVHTVINRFWVEEGDIQDCWVDKYILVEGSMI